MSIGEFGWAAEFSPITIGFIWGRLWYDPHFVYAYIPSMFCAKVTKWCMLYLHSFTSVLQKQSFVYDWFWITNTFQDISNLLEVLRIRSTMSSSSCYLVISSNLSMAIQTVWISLNLLDNLEIFAHRWPPYQVTLLILFLFLRKISPELTAASPPLFAEEDWPWANIHAHLPLLYTWDTCDSMACQAVPRPHPESEAANPGPWNWNVCTEALSHRASPNKLVLKTMLFSGADGRDYLDL